MHAFEPLHEWLIAPFDGYQRAAIEGNTTHSDTELLIDRGQLCIGRLCYWTEIAKELAKRLLAFVLLTRFTNDLRESGT
jgi:hypothetical protein